MARKHQEASRMYMLSRLLLLSLTILALGPSGALAQPAPAAKTKVAKQYVDAGLAAQSTADYDTAITMYSKAYELVPHPLLIFNMAQAHRLAGHIEQALTLYAQYLVEAPNTPQAQTARELVAELEGRKAEQVRKAGAQAKPGEATDEYQPDAGSKRIARKPHNGSIDHDSTSGTLIVKARNQSGDTISDGAVIVDDDSMGQLVGGKLTLPRIVAGRHTVAIEAGGYQRFEEAVTVRDGEQARLDALLIERAALSPSPRPTAWKVSLGVSLAALAAGTGFAVLSFSKINTQLSPSHLQIVGAPGATVGAQDCGKQYDVIINNSNPKLTSFNYSALQAACTWRSKVYVGYAIGGIGLTGAVVALIMLTRNTKPSDVPAPRARRNEPEAAILPIVMPSGGGASFTLTW